MFHKVEKKDTYVTIAKQYGIKVTDLKKMNGIKSEEIKKYVGKELKVGPVEKK